MHGLMRTLSGCLLILFCGLMAAGFVARRADRRIREIEQQYASSRETDLVRLVQDHELRVQEEARISQEHMSRQREARIRALGGPLQAALKDPSLDIRGLLEVLMREILPDGSVVTVRVERFTDFLVFAELGNKPSAAQLTAWLGRFMPHASRYVHTVRFVHAGEVVGELDRAEVESVKDWNDPSAADVAARLLQPPPEADPVAQAPGPAARVKEELERDDLDESQTLGDDSASRIRRGEKRFFKRFADANQVVLETFGLVQSHLNPRNSTIEPGANGLIRRFNALGEAVDRVYGFLVNPLPEYERMLTVDRVDPVYIQASGRGLMRRYGAGQEAELMLLALRDEARAMRDFALFLDRNRSAWEMVDGKDEIRFLDAALGKSYSEQLEARVKGLKRVQDAIQSWADKSWKTARKGG